MRILQSDAYAADCHGFLCGYICVKDVPLADIWKEYLDIRSDDDLLVSGCYKDIDVLISETMELFKSSNLDFYLLLPDDTTPISDRVSALSEWCHGFLNSFALGEDVEQTLVDEDSKELIENFTRICQLEVSDKPDQSDEKALFELVEYVRMGAVYIYTQSFSPFPDTNKSGVYH